MPDFSKSPPELIERFGAITSAIPDAERRQMFGYPALFVGGYHVTGLYQATWIVRLAEADRAELLALPGSAPFEPMPGRSMGGYVVLPPSIVAEDDAVRSWVERAIERARSLPPKPAKARKRA
jgi:TfoX/Sxy family transcriptional regulator of competence genes